MAACPFGCVADLGRIAPPLARTQVTACSSAIGTALLPEKSTGTAVRQTQARVERQGTKPARL